MSQRFSLMSHREHFQPLTERKKLVVAKWFRERGKVELGARLVLF